MADDLYAPHPWWAAPAAGNLYRVRGGLHITETTGDRWDLALDLLREGRDVVALDEVAFRRDTHGPSATGRVVISIATQYDPRTMTSERGRAEVDRARAVVDRLRSEDDRFAQLLDGYGATWEYIYDYDTGGVLLATVDDGGTLHWQENWRPSA